MTRDDILKMEPFVGGWRRKVLVPVLGLLMRLFKWLDFCDDCFFPLQRGWGHFWGDAHLCSKCNIILTLKLEEDTKKQLAKIAEEAKRATSDLPAVIGCTCPDENAPIADVFDCKCPVHKCGDREPEKMPREFLN
jgi:hypothetical protein